MLMNRRQGCPGGEVQGCVAGGGWAALPWDWPPLSPSIIHKIVFESRAAARFNNVTALNLISIMSLAIRRRAFQFFSHSDDQRTR